MDSFVVSQVDLPVHYRNSGDKRNKMDVMSRLLASYGIRSLEWWLRGVEGAPTGVRKKAIYTSMGA